MITPKQRKYLKSLANGLKPIIQMGKDGDKETFIRQLDLCLEDHELVKVDVLDSSPMKAKEAMEFFINRLDAEFVQVIGRKFILYRESEKELKNKIELPRQ